MCSLRGYVCLSRKKVIVRVSSVMRFGADRGVTVDEGDAAPDARGSPSGVLGNDGKDDGEGSGEDRDQGEQLGGRMARSSSGSRTDRHRRA